MPAVEVMTGRRLIGQACPIVRKPAQRTSATTLLRQFRVVQLSLMLVCLFPEGRTRRIPQEAMGDHTTALRTDSDWRVQWISYAWRARQGGSHDVEDPGDGRLPDRRCNAAHRQPGTGTGLDHRPEPQRGTGRQLPVRRRLVGR